jgi:predicted nucleotidyltransferase
MRTSAPPLLPIFRSQLQGELLAAVLLADTESSISGLAVQLGAPVATVQREVTRLERAGILTSRRIGHTRLVKPDRSSPVHEPLTELVLRSFGPAAVLARELGAVDGIQRAEVFGSWAARYRGQPGPPPGDIDVLVVGDPDRDDVYDAARRAEQRLGREVNPVVVSPLRWENTDEPFLRGLQERPRVAILEEDESAG